MEDPEANAQDPRVGKADMYKSLFDFFKHLTTLSAGSVLLVATLLEKLFSRPRAAWLVSLSVGGFLVCLVASMLSYGVFVLTFPAPGVPKPTERETMFMASTMVIGGMAFIVGIGALGLFFLRNWNP